MKGEIGFDPWLHSHKEIVELSEAFADKDIGFVPSDNLIDKVWLTRPLKVSNRNNELPC